MKSTIRDVAKLAKVSPATVSRYFSGSSVVGSESSRRIEEAARELQYVPVKTVKHYQGIILVIVQQLQLEYFREALRELFLQIPKYNCKMIVFPLIEGDNSYKSILAELNVVGVIYLDEDIDSNMLRYIRAKNIKIIMLGGIVHVTGCDFVHINDMAAAYEGMNYLLDLNHKDILLLGDYEQHFSSGYQRLAGCQQALKLHNLEYDENLVEHGELTYEGGYKSTRNALKHKKNFTAIFAFSDEAAMGAMSALAEKGLRVPQDISVMGFDGLPISGRITPKLTTIYQPIDKMVEWTLDTLCVNSRKKIMDNMEFTLPYQLLERETCIRREEEL